MRLCGRTFAGDRDLYLTPAKWRSIAQQIHNQRSDEAMAVFRVERNKELTLKAKGLLSQMLSLPED